MEFPRCISNASSTVISAAPQYSERQMSNAITIETFPGSMDGTGCTVSSWKPEDKHRACLPPQQDYRCSAVSLFLQLEMENAHCSWSEHGKNTHPFGSQRKHRFLIVMDKK